MPFPLTFTIGSDFLCSSLTIGLFPPASESATQLSAATWGNTAGNTLSQHIVRSRTICRWARSPTNNRDTVYLVARVAGGGVEADMFLVESL